ncbi:MAG: hypothetical protein JEY99_18240 [Spirochaetales bacterium]|nr:hypothetical protein [Spirochaetales bacterium]
MIVISLKRLLISLCIIITVTIILITSGLALNGGEGWQLKIELQNFFFWGLIVLLVQVGVGGTLIFSHKKLMENIKRLSTFEDFNSMNAEKAFEKLGRLGEEIRKVLRKENQFSVMRANRIAVLNDLVHVLCEGYSEPIMVTDINGVIFTISDKLKNRITKENGGVSFSNIVDIKPDIKLTEVLGFIEKQRTSWKDAEKSSLVCTPVYDKNSSVQFCIWEFETSFFTGKFKELTQQKTKIAPAYKKSIDFLNRFRRKNGRK